MTDPGVTSRTVYLPAFKLADGSNGAWYDTRTVTTLKWDDAARKLTGGAPETSVKVL